MALPLAPAPHDRTRSLGPALFGALGLLAGVWWVSHRAEPVAPAPRDAEVDAPSPEAVEVAVRVDASVAEVVAPAVACDPPCAAGSFCREGVCHPFAEVQCEGRAACDGPSGRECYDAVSPCDTGYAMTPCQSPGRRECRDGGVVCIPTGRTAGGCSPPNGGVCDMAAQCRCPPERPSSCADWWAQPGQRVCVDMTTDDSHCGGCDRICDASGSARAVCREGRCVCPQGTVACDEMGDRALYVRCRTRCETPSVDSGTRDGSVTDDEALDAGTGSGDGGDADAGGRAPTDAVIDAGRRDDRSDDDAGRSTADG